MTAPTATLADFILARLAEDEAVARAATQGPWYWQPPTEDDWPNSDESLMARRPTPDGEPEGSADEPVLTGWGFDSSGIDAERVDRDHIARHDPARVLAQCAALRKIVEKAQRADAAFARQLTPTTSAAVMAMTEVVTMLAAIWADHEDYEAAVS